MLPTFESQKRKDSHLRTEVDQNYRKETRLETRPEFSFSVFSSQKTSGLTATEKILEKTHNGFCSWPLEPFGTMLCRNLRVKGHLWATERNQHPGTTRTTNRLCLPSFPSYKMLKTDSRNGSISGVPHWYMGI